MLKLLYGYEWRDIYQKASRIWYKLNEGTNIKVRTGAGMSESLVIGVVVGQGTLGGAPVSQAVLDEGVCEKYEPGDIIAWNTTEYMHTEIPFFIHH